MAGCHEELASHLLPLIPMHVDCGCGKLKEAVGSGRGGGGGGLRQVGRPEGWGAGGRELGEGEHWLVAFAVSVLVITANSRFAAAEPCHESRAAAASHLSCSSRPKDLLPGHFHAVGRCAGQPEGNRPFTTGHAQGL